MACNGCTHVRNSNLPAAAIPHPNNPPRRRHARVPQPHQMAAQRRCRVHPTGLVPGPLARHVPHQHGLRQRAAQLLAHHAARLPNHRPHQPPLQRHLLPAAGAPARQLHPRRRRQCHHPGHRSSPARRLLVQRMFPPSPLLLCLPLLCSSVSLSSAPLPLPMLTPPPSAQTSPSPTPKTSQRSTRQTASTPPSPTRKSAFASSIQRPRRAPRPRCAPRPLPMRSCMRPSWPPLPWASSCSARCSPFRIGWRPERGRGGKRE